VEGVSGLQIEYGEDTTGDFFVDGYVDASAVANWESVTSVRPVLRLRSLDSVKSAANEAAGINQADRMEQVMTSTIGIRNRLP